MIKRYCVLLQPIFIGVQNKATKKIGPIAQLVRALDS